jgi:hypothetical protein
LDKAQTAFVAVSIVVNQRLQAKLVELELQKVKRGQDPCQAVRLAGASDVRRQFSQDVQPPFRDVALSLSMWLGILSIRLFALG